MSRPRIFVPNKGGHDYSPALKFGDLVFVSEGYIDRWGVSQMYRLWVKALEDSKSDDYIMETSLNTLCSVGAAIFGHKHGRLNLLIFKAENGEYIERSIKLDELVEKENKT